MAPTATEARAMTSTAASASGRRTVGRLLLPALALSMLALLFAPGVSATDQTVETTAPRADPTTTAKSLVDRFFVLLARKDHAGLQRFLSPAFQVERADGSGSGKKEYLARLATINRFRITKLKATQTGATLVVRYLAEVKGVVNGKRYAPGPAPRLSVFTWNGRRWQLVAHANFNPLTG